MQNDISITYVQLLLTFIKQNKLMSEALLSQPCFANIDALASEQEGFSVPRVQVLQMLDSIDLYMREQLNQPLCGIDIGKHITAAHFGVLGYVLLACPSLDAVLMRVDKYARLVDRAYFMQVQVRDKQLELRWPLIPSEVYHPVFAEMGLAAIVQFARNMTNQKLKVNQLCFIHDAIAPLSHYQQFFGGQVLFNQPDVLIQVDINYLNLPPRQPDEALLKILENQAKQALAKLPRQEQFLKKVQGTIMMLSRESLPTLAQVSKQLNMSPRTLQRKLSDYDLTYKDLLDSIQQHLAEQYLADERLQLIEVAQLLGYSDQSAFTRAFKRWLGMTPKAYRLQLAKSLA